MVPDKIGNELVVYDPFNYPQCSKEDRQKLLDRNKKAHLNALSELERLYFKPLFALRNKQLAPLSLKVKVPPEIPAQNNSWDCGVFLTTFVKYLLLNRKFDFKTEDMIDIRESMKIELQTGQLRNPVEENIQKMSKDDKSGKTSYKT